MYFNWIKASLEMGQNVTLVPFMQKWYKYGISI